MPRLVVIDDDLAVQMVFRRAFQVSDVAVVGATTGRDGLEAVVCHRPDVILLDIQLPDTSGLDLFQDIRQADATIPVIFITASGTSETAIEAMKLGAYDYLLKPLDLPKLRDLVERALEIRRLMHVPVELAGADAEAAPMSHSVR